MSDLTAFRDHCRKMAGVAHKPECPSLGPKSTPVWEMSEDGYAMRWVGNTPPPPACDGCNPAADRALFERLAGEVDEYLGRSVDVDLFGELSEMPTVVEESADEPNPLVSKGIRGAGGVESEAQSGPESARTDRGLATVSTRPKGA